MPRRDDDDDDDRPRTRRRQYDDDDDDYDPRPKQRARQPSQALPLIIAGVVILGLLVIGGAGLAIYFSWSRAPAPQPAVAINAPPPAANAMRPVAPGPVAPPAGPGMQPAGPAGPPPVAMPGAGLPAAPVNQKVTISNLRVQRGFGGKNELAFDYQFPGGRPIGLYTAVVMEPGSAAATADLHSLEQQGTITLSSIGPFGGNWRSGTQVYVGNHAIGLRNIPSAISNTLTLP